MLKGRPHKRRQTAMHLQHAPLATAVTLLLVPVFYAVFVLDLKIVHWARGSI
jgi:hypothetical protein